MFNSTRKWPNKSFRGKNRNTREENWGDNPKFKYFDGERENNSKHLNADKINKIERGFFVLEKRRLGSDFCDFCDLEFNLGSEKDRKEILNLKTKKT